MVYEHRTGPQMSDEELVVESIRAMARILSRTIADVLQPARLDIQHPETPAQEQRTTGEMKLITAYKLADILSIPVTGIYRLAKEDKIPVIRIGRALRFDLAAVSDVLGMDYFSTADGSTSKGAEE